MTQEIKRIERELDAKGQPAIQPPKSDSEIAMKLENA